MGKRTIAAFRAVVSGADLKRALEERRQSEARRDRDIETVRAFISKEAESREASALREYIKEADDAYEAFARLAKELTRA